MLAIRLGWGGGGGGEGEAMVCVCTLSTYSAYTHVCTLLPNKTVEIELLQ